jgi:hypothetical protein
MLGGLPEGLAMEMVANGMFHGHDRADVLLARTRMLWNTYGAQIDLGRLKLLARPLDLLREAPGLDFEDIAALTLAYYGYTRALQPARTGARLGSPAARSSSAARSTHGGAPRLSKPSRAARSISRDSWARFSRLSRDPSSSCMRLRSNGQFPTSWSSHSEVMRQPSATPRRMRVRCADSCRHPWFPFQTGRANPDHAPRADDRSRSPRRNPSSGLPRSRASSRT